MDWAGEQQKAGPGEVLRRYYATLLTSLGPQGWWPAQTRWEVVCGAILTQNTTWRNAALAIARLRKAGRLAWRSMRQISREELERLIRPAGFFRQKARTLRSFIDWLERAHGGSLDSLFRSDSDVTRAQLLALKGIGPETADAILLYAGQKPSFVADAYTRRILSRHKLLPASAGYASARRFLHTQLPPDASMFNEFHALLVEAGKRFCHRGVAHCEECPLGTFMDRNSSPETRNSPDLVDFGSRLSTLESA